MTLTDVMLFLAVTAITIALVYATGMVPRAVDWLRRQDMVTRIVVVLVFSGLAVQGSGKGPVVVRGILRMLFWDHPLTWPLSDAYLKTQSAVATNEITETALVEVEAVTNDVVAISFDWHAPTASPTTSGRTCWRGLRQWSRRTSPGRCTKIILWRSTRRRARTRP